MANIQLAGADALSKLTTDFKRLKRQKARPTGGVEARVLMNIGFLNGLQYLNYQNRGLYVEQQEPNKLYLMWNLIQPRVNKLIGRISSIAPIFKANPDRKDPAALEESEVVDRMIQALDQKLNQPAKTWEHLWWLAVGGVSFEHIPWLPNAGMELNSQKSPSGELMFKDSQTNEVMPETAMHVKCQMEGLPPERFDVAEQIEQVGDVGAEVLGPLNVFIDQSVHSIRDLAPDQKVYIAKIRTVGWVKDNFGVDIEPEKDLNIVSTQFHQNNSVTQGIFLRDMIPLIQGSTQDTDPEMAVIVEAYGPPSLDNPHGTYECFQPGKTVIHQDVNPYDEIPIVDIHWKPVTTSFWTTDYVTDLIPAQRFINKRMSQLGEQSNAALYSNLLLGPGLKNSDIPADYPGVVEGGLDDAGNPRVGRMAPPEIPQWFMESITTSLNFFNDIAGGTDLMSDSKFPGQLRGPLAVPMLQEILDSEWGNFYQHLGERFAAIKQQRLNRVKQFYPPIRTMHYMDRDQRDEVVEFHTDDILRAGTEYNVTVERGSLLPELRALREARVAERLSGPLSILYVDERTGRLDKSKIAADLQFGDLGREGREAQYRKLSAEIIGMLWKGQQIPGVLPFYDHAQMMDELESAMATTEYLRASPQIQQGFIMRWEQHRAFMGQLADQANQAAQGAQIQSAVAQATQQAAAMAAAEAVKGALGQVSLQAQMPTDQLVQSAAQANGLPTPGAPQRPPAPPNFRG
jgi:hypothetical protein